MENDLHSLNIKSKSAISNMAKFKLKEWKKKRKISLVLIDILKYLLNNLDKIPPTYFLSENKDKYRVNDFIPIVKTMKFFFMGKTYSDYDTDTTEFNQFVENINKNESNVAIRTDPWNSKIDSIRFVMTENKIILELYKSK